MKEQNEPVELRTHISSIPENAAALTGFTLYPNPAYDLVNLSIVNSNDDIINLNIYNAFGLLVKSETIKSDHNQINTGDLSNGIYYVAIKLTDRLLCQKLIIQR